MSTVFVYTAHQTGVGAWSRYEFPYQIEETTQLDGVLYLRTGDKMMRVTDTVYTDETATGVFTPFDGIVQWAWLDFGSPGRTKQMVGIDVVGTGIPSVAVGFDQTNLSAFTTDYDIPADTVPGMIVPFPVAAPTFSMRLTYKGGAAGQYWKLNAMELYLNDMAPTR